MFDTMKFGKALSTLRKSADMTQNDVADRLNLSRQTISKDERGESFPDISVLVMIADLFQVTLDQLIDYGEPTHGESLILETWPGATRILWPKILPMWSIWLRS